MTAPRTRMPEPPRPTFRERLAALRYVPALLALVWNTHRGFTTGIVALRIVRAFVPLAALWVGKLIIDTVVALTQGAGDAERLWRLVAMEIAIVIAGELLARAST